MSFQCKAESYYNKFFEHLVKKYDVKDKKMDYSITFEEYFQEMINFFDANNQNLQMINEAMEGSEKAEISSDNIK